MSKSPCDVYCHESCHSWPLCSWAVPAAAVSTLQRCLACRSMATQSSELGDERPLVACAFRPDGAQLAVGSWTGLVKLWASPACSLEATYRCHDDRITGAAPSPGLPPSVPERGVISWLPGSLL